MMLGTFKQERIHELFRQLNDIATYATRNGESPSFSVECLAIVEELTMLIPDRNEYSSWTATVDAYRWLCVQVD